MDDRTVFLVGFSVALLLYLAYVGYCQIRYEIRRRRVRRVLKEIPTVALPPVRPSRTPRHANGTPVGRVLPPVRVGQPRPGRGGPPTNGSAA